MSRKPSDVADFRLEVRSFLEPFAELDGFFGQGQRWPAVKAFFRAMGARGWLSLGWPEAAGGLALGPEYEFALWDEVAYARAARNPLAAGVVARTLLRHGTPEQRDRWLPPIRLGEVHFALGYSEPEAGSDLASVRCRAERRGDVYVIEGEKCWQSYAQDMDVLWLLCRTGTLESRSRGLSLLMVPLDAPGVRVTALPTLDGDRLSAIELRGVEVPEEHRVGPENAAWGIMGEALADERHIQFPPGRVRRDLDEVVAWLRRRGLTADPGLRRRLADLAVRVQEVEIHAARVLEAICRGTPAVSAAAANKVVHTLVCQEIAAVALEFGGPAAVSNGSRMDQLWRQALWETIGGGTSEVMRSVVAREELGLAGRR
ncbi:MAG: acyl-CoA dehydrogenase family protein [Myxococcota bacterium]